MFSDVSSHSPPLLSLFSYPGGAVPLDCLLHDVLAQVWGTEEMASCHQLQTTKAFDILLPNQATSEYCSFLVRLHSRNMTPTWKCYQPGPDLGLLQGFLIPMRWCPALFLCSELNKGNLFQL